MKKEMTFFSKLHKQRVLVFMSVPFLIHLMVFSYVPMWGWIMAFMDYKPAKSIFKQTWVGFKHFSAIFTDDSFYRVMRNTLAMSTINLVLGTIAAVGLAVIINEVRISFIKRSIQTVSYLPHFISWVVAANMIITVLSPDGGVLNQVLCNIGIIDKPILFLGKPGLFWWIIGFTNVWKEVGWNAIIYLSAIAGIDSSMYEAADIDGAGRIGKIVHITVPGIKGIFVVLLILNTGQILNTGFEQQYLLGNSVVYNNAEVFDLYVLNYGIKMLRYSFATAAGIFKSVISVLLIFGANAIAKRMGQERLI